MKRQRLVKVALRKGLPLGREVVQACSCGALMAAACLLIQFILFHLF